LRVTPSNHNRPADRGLKPQSAGEINFCESLDIVHFWWLVAQKALRGGISGYDGVVLGAILRAFVCAARRTRSRREMEREKERDRVRETERGMLPRDPPWGDGRTRPVPR